MFTAIKLNRFPVLSSVLTVFLLLVSVPLSSQVAPQASGAQPVELKRVVARVNGVPINERQVRQQMEFFYPANRVHGGLTPEKLKEIRSKAVTELVLAELMFQQAVKENALIPMLQVEAEYRRIRTKFGPRPFDESLKAEGTTRQEYLKSLQRRMTLEQAFQNKVYLPSRVRPEELRAYYDKNLNQFRRPEQVHAYLFLAAAERGATPEADRQAKQKAEMVYQKLKAGESFEDLAAQYSDDRYRIKGGDLGWVHKGRLDPEFEKVAFGLQPGEVSAVFRTDYGYNLMKVTDREGGRLMKFEEVQANLQARLENDRLERKRTEVVEAVMKGARIELLDPSIALTLAVKAGAVKPATPMAAH